MTIEKAKAKLTNKNNIKLTLSPYQAKFILSLIGPTIGSLGYSIYGPLSYILKDDEAYKGDVKLGDIDSDKFLKGVE